MEVKVWKEVNVQGDLYSARTGHTVSMTDRYIYLFGGTDGHSRKNDIYQYDPVVSQWEQLQPQGRPPCARSGSQSVCHEFCIYFFGGYTKKDGDYFNDLFKFDTLNCTWAEMLPHNPNALPPARTDHSLIEYQNSLFVFGGYDGINRYCDLHCFSLNTRTWKEIPSESPPENRFGHSTVVCKDRMVVFGGWNGHETLNDVWSFQFQTSRWNQLPTSGFISPRYRHSAVTLGNSIFVFGGVNKQQLRFDDLYEFNINLKHWLRIETTGAIPAPRTFHKSVVFESHLFILGGFDGTRKNDMYKICVQDISPEEDLESNPLMQTNYSTEDYLEWKRLESEGSSYSARTGHCAVGYEGKFFVFGGTDEESRRNDLYCFDTKVWTQVSCRGEVPYPRSGAQGISYKQAIFIFGGYTRKDGNYFNDLHRFDIENTYWTKIFPTGELPSPRTDHSCVMYENNLFVFAGYDGKTRFNDLRACNLDTYEWVKIPENGSIPIKRFGHTAVVCHHNMYIFGGWDGHETLDDLYQFNFVSGIWYELGRVVGSRPNPRYRHSCVAYNKSLFIFGGVDKQQNRYNDLFEFNIQEREWTLKRTSGSIPTARTFHRAVLYDQKMYILGGFDGKRQNDLYVIRLHCENSDGRPSSSMSRLFELEDHDNDGDYNKLLKQNFLLKQQVKDLSQRLEKEQERDACKICFEREIDSILLECAHRFMCYRCASKFDSCPVCRQQIVRKIRTYNAN